MVLKVKDWLNVKPQFIVKDRYFATAHSFIKAVQRIKDDAIFKLYDSIDIDGEHELDVFRITLFYNDLIHVQYVIETIKKGKKFGTCSIDSIILTDDFKFVKIDAPNL